MAPKFSRPLAGYQMTPFEVGQVKAHMEHGLGCTKIARRVFKPDGSEFGEQAISTCMHNLRENLDWRGERKKGSGAPRKTTRKQDKEIVKFVKKQRGRQKVTVKKVKKQFPHLRQLGDTLVERRLEAAEMVHARRRDKPIVVEEHLAGRIEYCEDVKRKHQSTLERWAYTDGAVFYLDRTGGEHENSKRRALGTHVWRMQDGSDALFADCIGTSSYSKGQGYPLKVWGVLAHGALYIHILEQGETMCNWLYSDLVDDKFSDWCGNCEYVVCDYEHCLRSQEAVDALHRAGLKLVDPYPVASQDFNAIENAWDILRKRLDETMPVRLETRDAFVVRLHAAVKWMNVHRAKQLWYLSTNQKERCEDCLSQDPPGGRTKW